MASSSEDLQFIRERARSMEDLISQLHQEYAQFPEYASEISASYREELFRLRSEIDLVLGISSLPAADATLRIEAKEDLAEGPRASLLVDSISAFKSALTRVTLGLLGPDWDGPGRHPAELRRMVDFRVSGLAKGSVRIGISFEASVYQTVLPGYSAESPLGQVFWKAVEHIWNAGYAIAEGASFSDLAAQITDPRIRLLVVREIARLSPTSRGRVRSMSLEGGVGLPPTAVVLTPATRRHAFELIYPGSKIEDFDDVGVLRAIEVDEDKMRNRFALRQRPEGRPDVEGDFGPGLRFQVLEAIDKATGVRIRGVLETKPARRTKPVLHLEQIDPLTLGPQVSDEGNDEKPKDALGRTFEHEKKQFGLRRDAS
jgi:hypothetical protein